MLAADLEQLKALVKQLPAENAGPALARFAAPHWRILIAGKRSVGKSSFVCALWQDAELVPTAVRDCTQTNTLIRTPEEGEADPHLQIAYLERERALNFAAGDLSTYRLIRFLEEETG